jgi:hypothetical protein
VVGLKVEPKEKEEVHSIRRKDKTIIKRKLI